MTWIAPIWLYLWMAGMAGGAYFAAFLAERFAGETNRKLLRLSVYLGIPLAIIGVMLLVIDLGHPLRFWHLFTQFKVISPMSMGTWILLLWVGIAVVMVILWWVENRLVLTEQVARKLRKTIDNLAWVNLVLSVLLIAYTGVLLAVSNQPLWAGTVLLPSLFVASAISTGVAILIITAMIANVISRGNLIELKMAINWLFGSNDWTIPNRRVERLAEADAIIILVELAVLIGYAIWLGASTMAGAGEALRLLTMGALAVPFWVGVVLLALLIPFGLDIANWGKEIEAKAVWRTIAVSSVCVILGGLVLRALMVIGGQM
ncbi:NrfD/PsrC family molybdoenzyme membrane anchor subunit [Chloroflexota bacterium]